MTKDFTMKYAIKLLTNRMYTVMEMSDKLIASGASTDIVDDVLFQLCKSKLLDDLNYATLYIEDSVNLKSKGRFRIQSELAAKGIDKKIIEQAFTASEVDEFTGLLNYIESYTRGKTFECYNDVEKLKAHLYRKGYLSSDINAAVRESGIKAINN